MDISQLREEIHAEETMKGLTAKAIQILNLLYRQVQQSKRMYLSLRMFARAENWSKAKYLGNKWVWIGDGDPTKLADEATQGIEK